MKFPFSLPLLLDGATGTNLLERGMPSNVCVEEWICQNPAILQQLQKEFIDAGAQAIYAPTFGANRACLARYGLEDKVEEFNRKLVALSKQVAKPKNILVGGSLCPTGLFVPPYGEADFDDIYEIYREQIRVLDEAEVDFLIIETQTSLADMRAAVLAARSTNLPVFVTITVDKNGQTATGGTLLPVMITLQSMGVDAIGLNCSFGPEDMTEFINDIAQHSRVPIIAKPNAGLPSHYNGGNGYLSPDEFSHHMESQVETVIFHLTNFPIIWNLSWKPELLSLEAAVVQHLNILLPYVECSKTDRTISTIQSWKRKILMIMPLRLKVNLSF